MRDRRRVSRWTIRARRVGAARLNAAADAERTAHGAPTPPDGRLAPPMVAVGAVSDRRSRLWLRTDASGPFTVEVWTHEGEGRAAAVAYRRTPEADGTMAFTLPDDTPAIRPLTPATIYSFRIMVTRTGEPVGEGRFETAPPEGARGSFTFAFMSCHQPFCRDGSMHLEAARMLATLEPALEGRGVKYVLCIGDQIYADGPRASSLLRTDRERPLLEASVNTICARYQARYRQFWAFPEVRRLQARWPTWYIWDDHEIVNG
jgi:phosphodiesterase/alkaline phosphatase D-like protein